MSDRTDHLPDPLDSAGLQPGQEPLTPEEKERYLARVRAQGRLLTAAEVSAIYGPAPEPPAPATQATDAIPAEPAEPAQLAAERLAALTTDFFPEVPRTLQPPDPPLVRGVIFDFDYTLAEPALDLDAQFMAGAQAADAYMRSTGMVLPADFAAQLDAARRFAGEKSSQEQEEHLADDAASFLLQFVGYPASRMDPVVLRLAVDILYAPEMTAWRLRPGVQACLAALRADGYRLALIAHHPADRIFQRIVDYLGLRAAFDMVVSSAAVEYRKPDARIFQSALDRWDALPYEVVIVGDSLREDIQAGIALGALTVLVRAGSSPQVEHDNGVDAGLIRPDAVIEQLSDLPALVHQWAH